MFEANRRIDDGTLVSVKDVEELLVDRWVVCKSTLKFKNWWEKIKKIEGNLDFVDIIEGQVELVVTRLGRRLVFHLKFPILFFS